MKNHRSLSYKDLTPCPGPKIQSPAGMAYTRLGGEYHPFEGMRYPHMRGLPRVSGVQYYNHTSTSKFCTLPSNEGDHYPQTGVVNTHIRR